MSEVTNKALFHQFFDEAAQKRFIRFFRHASSSFKEVLMREQSFSTSISDHFAHPSTSLRIAWVTPDWCVRAKRWCVSIGEPGPAPRRTRASAKNRAQALPPIGKPALATAPPIGPGASGLHWQFRLDTPRRLAPSIACEDHGGLCL